MHGWQFWAIYLVVMAVVIATVTQDMLGRVRPRLKWIWIGLGLLWLAEGVFNLLDQQWFLGTLFLILAAGAAFMPQLATWDARRAGRSAEANRRLPDRT
jgi:uncharacterized membrane protein